MFGYVRISKPELRVKEYELYKAVYCSLCKELGKSYGLLSRLTLSYDFTFLALLNMSFKDGCDCFKKGRCAFNPLKKCNYTKDTDSLKMPSAAAMIMLYYNLKDNIADEKGIKKIAYLFMLPFFASAHKKAKKNYPQIEDIVSVYIKNQNELEKNNCDSLDMAADPSAKALSQILMLCSDDPVQKRVLDRIGYCLGRYIYLLDAACDLERDRKNGSYNVLKNYDETDVKVKKIVPQLYWCINEASRAFELLNIKKYKNVLGNIVYLGLEETFKKELNI